MKNKILLSLILIFAFAVSVYSESTDINPEKNSHIGKKSSTINEPYIEKVKNDFTFKLVSSISSFDFSIDRLGSNQSLNYYPEDLERQGFEVSYKYLSLGYSQDLSNPENNTDFYFSFFQEKIGINASYQVYKNFKIYDDNEHSYTDLSNSDFPDLKLTNLNFSFYYFFNDSYSYKAAFLQTERQKRFGWSPFVTIRPSYFSFKNDGPIIPVNIQSLYGKYGTVHTREIYSFSALIGLSCTLTVFDFYFTPLFSLGWSFNKQNLSDSNNTYKEYSNELTFDLAFAAGYNGASFFAGLLATVDTTAGNFGDALWEYDKMQIKFFAGVRFL